MAAIQVAFVVWMVPGYFESEKISKLRRQGALITYDWQRPGQPTPDPRVNSWISTIKTGLYGQSPARVVDITLHDAFTDNRTLEHIGRNFPNLQWLRINDPNSRITVEGLKSLQNCRRLEGLTLWGRTIDDDFLEAVVALDGLRHLGFTESTIAARDLSPLRSLDQLRGLYLTGSDITDLQLAPISDMKTLITLDISGTRVTDGSAAILQELPQLQYVRAEHTDITLPAIQKWRETVKAGLPKIYTDLEVSGTYAVVRWADGRITGNVQPELPLHVTGPLGSADGAKSPSEIKVSFASGPLDAVITKLADGRYRVIAKDGDIESEPVFITVENGNAPDGRIEFRMPTKKSWRFLQ